MQKTTWSHPKRTSKGLAKAKFELETIWVDSLYVEVEKFFFE